MMWNIEYTVKRYVKNDNKMHGGEYQYTTYFVPALGAKPDVRPFNMDNKHTSVTWDDGQLVLDTSELVDLRIVPYNQKSN